MTIKKRLFISNILMIAVPVVITALIGLLCVGAIRFTVAHGTGIGFEDSEDFYTACQGISKMAERTLENAAKEDKLEGLTELSQVLDRNSMSLLVEADGQMLYSYGKSTVVDTTLMQAVDALAGEGFVSSSDRELFAHQVRIDGVPYSIFIFGTRAELSYGTLKVAIALAAIILAFGIFVSILLTNRFLTKFVFQRIEQPLKVLTNGVRQIRDGNLEYRINYEPEDEFAPICSDFNEMAVRLKQSVELTQQNEQSRKELLAGISHDLRSPLTTIRAYVEGLLDRVAKTPEAQQKYLLTIKSKTDDITRLVSQLFLFSKMELGDYPEHPEQLQLDDEVRQLVRALEQEYAENGLQLTTGNLIPAVISADPEQLRRVLVNIIENSLKYKDKEDGHLEISLREENEGFLLSLCDDGPGVPENALPHLFEVFYRSDPARQNSGKGSGLGLAIAANAVQRMKGTITAKNRETGGLEIAIWLPKVEE